MNGLELNRIIRSSWECEERINYMLYFSKLRNEPSVITFAFINRNLESHFPFSIKINLDYIIASYHNQYSMS